MFSDTNSLYSYCKDFQNLIVITEESIITPLRKEVRKNSQDSDILALEIRDAENKTFEYLAQLISAICNADEESGNIVLKDFPKSELCFRCLGIDEDTIQLLDMTDEEVRSILRDYGDSDDEIDHVLAGLAKIRGNIDLIESELTFEDDTRSFMKFVLQMSEETCISEEVNSSQSVSNEEESSGNRVPPLYVTGPETQLQNKKDFIARKENLRYSENLLTPNKCICNQLKVDGNPTSQHTVDVNNILYVNSNCDNHLKSMSYSSIKNQRNGFRSYHTMQNSNSSEFDVCDTEPGFSSSLNLFNQHKANTVANTSLTVLSRSSRKTLPTEYGYPVSPTARRFNCVRERDKHIRQVGTPPPKHRFKFTSPMHRSKSHESNLAIRINNAQGVGALINQDGNLSRHQLLEHNILCSDTLSNACGDHLTHENHNVRQFITTVPYPLYTEVIPNSTNHSSNTLHSNSAFDIAQTHSTNIRYASSEHHPPKNNLQPPALMTTSADGERLLGILNVPGNSGGTTFVISVSGYIHKFELESKFGDIVRGTPCSVCNNRMRFRLQHCVHCKIKIHKSCVSQSKRLPCTGPVSANEAPDFRGSSPSAYRKFQLNALPTQINLRPAHSTPAFQGCDSTSASSCTSSTPGSPFGLVPPVASFGSAAVRFEMGGANSISSPPPWSTHLPSPINKHTTAVNSAQSYSPRHNMVPSGPVAAMCCNQFEFPPIVNSVNENAVLSINPKAINNRQNADNNSLVSTLSSVESERTVVDNLFHRFESIDSQDESSILVRANSISVTLKEWDIPMENLVIGDLVGRGTFGTVYRARWHGEVAVKRINFDPEDPDDSIRMETFKREVALLHKTRHENLVLFMGACMKPPDLAIVTQLSQGETLFHILHQRESTLAINKIIAIASQIAKGMGYLHAKGIVHRDLKTRNIFLEDSLRVVIGDFGVFDFVRLCKKSKWSKYLNVPPFWMCYVAPEIIYALNPNYVLSSTTSELLFTPSSDVYAFGTVWYELLTNEFPFKGLPNETITYLIGSGFKQYLRIYCPKDFKEILTQCWAFNPSTRPEFITIVKLLDRLPKLHRSPSYPAKPYADGTSGSHGSLVV